MRHQRISHDKKKEKRKATAMVVAWCARLITRKKKWNEIKGLARTHCVASIHVLQSGTGISFSNFPMLKMFYSFIDFRVWRHRQPVGCVATNITWCSWTSVGREKNRIVTVFLGCPVRCCRTYHTSWLAFAFVALLYSCVLLLPRLDAIYVWFHFGSTFNRACCAFLAPTSTAELQI